MPITKNYEPVAVDAAADLLVSFAREQHPSRNFYKSVPKEVPLIFGVTEPEFRAMARAWLLCPGTTLRAGDNADAGLVLFQGREINVRMDPGNRWNRVAQVPPSKTGMPVCFVNPKTAFDEDIALELTPFYEELNRLVADGRLAKNGGAYYSPDVIFLPTGSASNASMMSREVYQFVSDIYTSGNSDHLAAALMFSARVVPYGDNDVRVEYAMSNRESIRHVSASGDGAYVAYKYTKPNGSEAVDTIKPGAMLKNVLEPWAYEMLSARDIEHFTNAWKARFGIEAELTFVSGRDLVSAYHRKNHERGSSASSCMSDDANVKQLDIYKLNPNQIKLAVVRSESGLINGRCLIWIEESGQMWYDRIYASERMMRFMESRFKEMGILSMQNDKRSFAVKIKLDHPWVDETPPYLDTVRYMNHEGMVRRMQPPEGGWIEIGHRAIRRGWPVCSICGTRRTAQEIQQGATAPCSGCVSAALKNPDARRIAIMDVSLENKTVKSLGGGILEFDGEQWSYDVGSMSLVCLSDVAKEAR